MFSDDVVMERKMIQQNLEIKEKSGNFLKTPKKQGNWWDEESIYNFALLTRLICSQTSDIVAKNDIRRREM